MTIEYDIFNPKSAMRPYRAVKSIQTVTSEARSLRLLFFGGEAYNL